MLNKNHVRGDVEDSVGVIIATKDRADSVAELVKLIFQQTVLPACVVVSGDKKSDIPDEVIQGTLNEIKSSSAQVMCLFGSRDLTVKRNNAMEKIFNSVDFIAFFDDDFLPSKTWIERSLNLFKANKNLVGLGGRVIIDGAKDGVVEFDEAIRIIEEEEIRGNKIECENIIVDSMYGCNMMFRCNAIGVERFDERLILYGWMEDTDFSRRMGRKGTLMRGGGLIGVHLGVRGGRISGCKFGYSQIVNAFYLMNKNSITALEAYKVAISALLTNALKSIRPGRLIDRRGRLRGNIVGLCEIAAGRCRPERAGDL